MILSPPGRDLIKGFESLSLTPYKDGGGVWTWGYGHAQGPHETVPKVITLQQAEAILTDDTSFAVQDVNTLVGGDIPQNIFDALVSFLFNIGITQLRAPTRRTMKAIQSHDWRTVCDLMMNWCHINGQFSQGLENRRKKETALILTGVCS